MQQSFSSENVFIQIHFNDIKKISFLWIAKPQEGVFFSLTVQR